MEKRHRYSRQRELILKALKAHHDHPTADDIFLEVRAMDSRISRGTVYRNLALLEKEDMIAKVGCPDAERFEANTLPHYHIRCRSCGKIMDAPLPYDESIDRRIEELTGCSCSHHTMTFDAICSECRAEEEKEKSRSCE